MTPGADFAGPALPYFCDPGELPGLLPTLGEIEAAETTLPCIWSPDDKRIVVVRGIFVVKYGIPRLVDGNEGYALLALRGVPSIPKLYAMYRQEGKVFLVMQYLPGTSLNLLWGDMSDQEKADVTQQLHDTFASVRKVPPPSPPVFGSVTGGPVPQRFFMTSTEDPAITGPFADEVAFHNAMALHLREDQASSNLPQWASGFLGRHLASAMGRHACVLTHGDLQRKNVLVVEAPPSPRRADSGDDRGPAPATRRLIVSGVVDWEEAGWMPSYWEYASMFIFADWDDDWTGRLEGIVDAWPSEAAMLMFVRRNFDGF